MKRNYIYSSIMLIGIIPCLFSCSTAHQDQTALLEEVKNKPTDKITVSLNSGNADKGNADAGNADPGTWSLYFGPQDENAPEAPGELKRSGFQRIDATVPGNVEIDLQNAGLIEDPMTGDNVYDLRKYESYQWWYHRSFNRPEIPQGHSVELCFDGIDCIADIWLNNKKIARIENMFVEHHYDITDLLERENELYICIYSTVLEARTYMRNNFGVRYDALSEAVSIRKAPHMFGWDILPRLISAGLWRDVKMEIIPPVYWKSVYWVTKDVNLKNRTASLYVDWEFYTWRPDIDDLVLHITLEGGNGMIFEKYVKLYTTVSRERIDGLNDVEFWWPRGFGEPALYRATMQILDPGGTVLCENIQDIGIRKTELILTELNTSTDPGEFVFKVNGEKVFIKGTNWVALDALHSRDRQHLGTAVDMLVDLNCNMIRLWGGNIYECDEFYEMCDENGIMVWQDFTMGCTTYPQSHEFAEKIRKEAEKVILRLRNHPSISLWAGNNENDVSLDWSGDQSNIDPNTDIISRQVLPLAVREYDPKTPYLPSSPYLSEESFQVANRINTAIVPEMHLWGPRGYYKAPFYTQNNAKFVSEIGYHGCPNRESLEKMMDEDFVYPWTNDFEWNDQWQAKATISHPNSTQNRQRNNLIMNQIICVFGEVPRDLDRFITASQIVQAEAKKYFIEFWRMQKFDRNGILWWNLRDGWPVISDAIVDYYGGKKLAYSYIRKVQTDVCVMIADPVNSKHPVVVVNDTREDVKGTLVIRDADTRKTVFSNTFSVLKNGKTIAGSLPETNNTKMWLIEWEIDGKKYSNHYLAYKPTIKLDDYLGWLPLLDDR